MTESASNEIAPLPGETIDPFMEGRLKIIQSKRGYRFSIDALLLADFVTIKKHDIVVDLGTGCGVIPLSMLVTKPAKHIYCIEIQEALASQAMRNAKLNNLENRMSVIMGDIRNPPLFASSANVVVCNPPYRRKESGRINPDKQRAIARHEIYASIEDIIKTAKYLLVTKGRLSIIYPAERMTYLIEKLRESGFEPKKLRVIYPDNDSNAKLVLMEAWLNANSGLTILPPIFGQGAYSIESQA